jgi:hypothetical protein
MYIPDLCLWFTLCQSMQSMDFYMLKLGTHHWFRIQYLGLLNSHWHYTYSQVHNALLPVIAAERMPLHIIPTSLQIITPF